MRGDNVLLEGAVVETILLDADLGCAQPSCVSHWFISISFCLLACCRPDINHDSILPNKIQSNMPVVLQLSFGKRLANQLGSSLRSWLDCALEWSGMPAIRLSVLNPHFIYEWRVFLRDHPAAHLHLQLDRLALCVQRRSNRECGQN